MMQRRFRGSWLAGGAILLGSFAGCLCQEHTVHKREPIDMPAPTGTFVRGFEEVQTTKAKASRLVIFLDEWFMGGVTLGPYGTRHLDDLSREVAHSPAVITIQPAYDFDLNAKRHAAIVAALKRAGITDAEHRVVVAFPSAEGLDGEEAERIYRQMLIPIFNYQSLGMGLLGGAGYGGYGGFGYGGGGLGGFGGFGGYGGFGGGAGFGMFGSNFGFGRPNGYLP